MHVGARRKCQSHHPDTAITIWIKAVIFFHWEANPIHMMFLLSHNVWAIWIQATFRNRKYKIILQAGWNSKKDLIWPVGLQLDIQCVVSSYIMLLVWLFLLHTHLPNQPSQYCVHSELVLHKLTVMAPYTIMALIVSISREMANPTQAFSVWDREMIQTFKYIQRTIKMFIHLQPWLTFAVICMHILISLF